MNFNYAIFHSDSFSPLSFLGSVTIIVPKLHFHIDTEHMTHHFDAQMHTMRCEYVKKNGERCKNNVIIGQPYCWIHERVGKHLKIAKSLIPDAGLGLFA